MSKFYFLEDKDEMEIEGKRDGTQMILMEIAHQLQRIAEYLEQNKK